MEKIYKLTQDNGWCNDSKKITVQISNSVLEYELRKFFGWRKNVTAKRLFSEGSYNYDLFIKHLSTKGFPTLS